MKLVVINIKKLVNVRKEIKLLHGKELSELPVIDNAYLIIEDGLICSYGLMDELSIDMLSTNIVDAEGQFVLPTWCDSHTHLVFAAPREQEFVDKLKGLTYQEIAAKGGGILNSAKAVEQSSEKELFDAAWIRLNELIQLGTGAIEIKTGYGLTVESEIKMLRVIDQLKKKSHIPVRSTFLGAHTYPAEFINNHKGYIDLIIEKMLPIIEKEKLADYIDVFCENGFFSTDEATTICNAGIKFGLKPKIHANQFSGGGVKVGINVNAISVDHLEKIEEEEIEILSKSNTIGTLLPTAAFFLRMPFQPARKLIDAGCAIALASDFNPGSSPSGNMNLVVAMSSIQMKMLPEEAINAATINGAYAMGLSETVGSITVGKKANLIFTKPIPSLAYLTYAFGNNHIDKVMINGNFIN